MITSPEPRELDAQAIKVASGTGNKVVNMTGYLDALIVDTPAGESFKFSIKGRQGVEYYLAPSAYIGDSTILFSPALPMTGKMTITILNASADGNFSVIPVGNIK